MKPVLIALLFATVALGQDIDLTGYTLTFEENFDTLSVSTSNGSKGASTWFFWPPNGPAGAYSLSNWSVINTMSVSGGILTNTAWYDPTNPTKYWRSGNLSSMDNTKQGFAQKYGYFACRMKMPNAGTGAWPAFWLLGVNHIPQRRQTALEIDVVEWYGNQPTKAYQRIHCWNPDNSDSGKLFSLSMPHPPTIPGGSASGQFHIYGVLVTPNFITWYIDGIQTQQVQTPTAWHTPMFVMVDYALGGGWPLTGEPFASHGSSSLLVDWVRVYSLPAAVPPTNLRITNQ